MRHRKQTNYPPNPTSLENLITPPEFLATDPYHPYHNGELLLLWDSGYSPDTKRTLLFSSKANLEILAEATNGWVTPCVYMLLPGKLTTFYIAALEALDPLPMVDFDPQTVLADYELAIRNSVSTIWPCTVVWGCMFHFKQALLRKAASIGLALFYNYKIIGSPVRRTIQLLGALAFVPEGDVYDAYHKIKPVLSQDVEEFFEYMESIWIGSPFLYICFSIYI